MEEITRPLKSGYKKTSVGVIPDDWEVKKLITQVTVDKENIGSEVLDEEHINYVSLSDVKDGRIFPHKILYKDAPSRARRKTKKGDVLLATVRPNLKNFAIVNEDNIIVSTGFAVLGEKKMNLSYLFSFLYSSEAEKQFFSLTVGSNYPALNSTDVKNLKLPIPPLPEQKDIADCLSTWDKTIEKQTQLINAKKEFKWGLMQRLLIGEERISGFEGEWKMVNAGKIFKNVSIKGFDDETLLSATQDRGVIPRDLLEGRVTMPKNGTKSYKLVQKGDFIISLRSFQGGLEYSEYRGIVSPAYTVLQPKLDIEREYYKYYFKTHHFIGHLAVAVIGIRDGKQISYEDFCFVKIPFPPLEEQIAIAQVLKSVDKEIELQENKLEQLQLQKKGLMQVLLTGEKRLV